MNVCLISCFRNSTPHIGRYFEQVGALEVALMERGDRLHLVLGEGDSVDDTRRLLTLLSAWSSATIVDCAHGGPEFGSVVDVQRFRQLGHVGRCLWAAIPADADQVLYVESDLIWDAATLVRLLDRLEDCPVVAPMVMFRHAWNWPADVFYDVWAFRKNGAHFNPAAPYFEGWPTDQLLQIDSAGSCVAMRAPLARELVWDEQVFVGACAQIYRLGGSVWLDPTLSILHRSR